MKIKYEREQRGTKVFTKKEFEEREKWFEKDIRPSLKGTPKDLPYMQFLFYNTKDEFKADQLFEENEIIKIRQNSFEQILENPAQRALLEQVDVLVDGRFVEALRDEQLRFRGSSNQRIIDVPRSLKEGNIVLLDI